MLLSSNSHFSFTDDASFKGNAFFSCLETKLLNPVSFFSQDTLLSIFKIEAMLKSHFFRFSCSIFVCFLVLISPSFPQKLFRCDDSSLLSGAFAQH